jgi:hypothetical protein
MVGESSAGIDISSKVNASDSRPGRLWESDINDSASINAYVERMKARQETYDRFCREFEISRTHGKITTTVTNEEGTIDKIEIHIYPEDPKIESTKLDHEEPIKFAPTTSHLAFYREKPPKEVASDENQLDFSWLDESTTVEELDAKVNQNNGNSPEKIQADLQKKFADLGMPDLPIAQYARRLLNATGYVQNRVEYKKAEMLMPLYRTLETKRLLTDPTDASIDHISIATQRQHVYNQLVGILRDRGMDSSGITRYMMEGIFNSHIVAGVPIFADDKSFYDTHYYVVVDCAYSGYDPENPKGTDFEGDYVHRSHTELLNILKRAKEHGYKTHFCDKGVSGGTDQHWQWNGIEIEGYDEKHPENNLPKVLAILKDSGIDPKEAACTTDLSYISDPYMR